MPNNEILMWASTQPVWAQVFIALVLFFVVLPLILTILGWLFVGVASLISPSTYSKALTTKPDSYESKELDDTEVRNTTKPDSYKSEELDGTEVRNQLLAALCVLYAGKKTEDQMREFIASKTDAEKRALLLSPQISRICDRLQAATASVTFSSKKP